MRAYLGEAKGNAAKAAILAGYSEKAARQIGSRLLTYADVQQAVGERVQKADLSTQARLHKLGILADTVPDKVTGADVLRANELILKVNGALKDKQSDARITVNIGFLTAAPPTLSITEAIDADAIDADTDAP